MSPIDPGRLERERRDADRRYNDALTALNTVVERLNAKPALVREDFAPLTHVLIAYLQQITAFVDTKDRQLGATAAEAATELHAKLSVLEGTVRAIAQSAVTSHQPPATALQPPALSPQPSALSPLDDAIYLAFEEQFRGPVESIQAKQIEYVPLFAGARSVVDIGCGRGEFLTALKQAGVAARGVDMNHAMVDAARARGLDAVQGDALAFLSSLPDESIDGLMSAQVVEHLEPSYLARLLDVARQKLTPGAVIALETINPACWLAFFSSYIRDLTHVRPIHPETLQFLVRAHGFERVAIRYSAPAPDHVKMRTVEAPPALQVSSDPAARALVQLMHAVNANATILNGLLFSHFDYAVIGFRS
ncbi:MAG: methyltransferase domain-containing protein [Acidobacteria bacterium]|nr:methyltransferase domain-containing protein [Acidobacteriota bacterium]